jgi:hypothetical protein
MQGKLKLKSKEEVRLVAALSQSLKVEVGECILIMLLRLRRNVMPKLVSNFTADVAIKRGAKGDKYTVETDACVELLKDPKTGGVVKAEFPTTLAGKPVSQAARAQQVLHEKYGNKYIARYIPEAKPEGGIFIFTAEKWAALKTQK